MKAFRHSAIRGRSAVVVVIFALVALFFSGCAAPMPVYLNYQTVPTPAQRPKGIKVTLVVEDLRPSPIRKVRMIGPLRGGFNNVGGFAFLSNLEHYDVLLARHMKDRLERAGYQVIGSFPEIPGELSSEVQQLGKEAFSTQERKAARDQEDTVIQTKSGDAPNSEQDAKVRFEKMEARHETLDLSSVQKWKDTVELPNTDAVIYARIGTIYADHLMVWPGAKLMTYFGNTSADVSVWVKDGDAYRPSLAHNLRGDAFTVDPWPFPRQSVAHSLMINKAFSNMIGVFEMLAFSNDLYYALLSP